MTDFFARTHSRPMPRLAPRATGPYRVVFTPQTWKEIGLMPTALFDAFQRAVDDLAEKCGRLSGPAPEKQPGLRFNVDVLVVTYERDDATRVITLVDITRAHTESP
jgi:hypothetical protein